MAVGGAAVITALNARKLVIKNEKERQEREKARQEQIRKKEDSKS